MPKKNRGAWGSVPTGFCRTDVTRHSDLDALVDFAAEFAGVEVMIFAG
jgi:hypothetical protein